MRYEIYDQSEDAPEREHVNTLRLFHEDDGSVTLKVVSSDGEVVWCGNLLQLTAKGKLRLNQAISPRLGFELDHRDSLVIDRPDYDD